MLSKKELDAFIKSYVGPFTKQTAEDLKADLLRGKHFEAVEVRKRRGTKDGYDVWVKVKQDL